MVFLVLFGGDLGFVVLVFVLGFVGLFVWGFSLVACFCSFLNIRLWYRQRTHPRMSAAFT